MPRYFAFLRGINLGGHTVTNARLVQLFAGAGIRDAEPFIASGNVAFESRGRAATLETKLSAHLARQLGYAVMITLRTHEELLAVAAREPFPPARRRSATVLNIGFLAGAVDAAQRRTIVGFADGESDFHVTAREVYWLCQVRQGESRFFRVPFERRIGMQCTWRNVNTVRRWLARYDRPADPHPTPPRRATAIPSSRRKVGHSR